jgi:hypothetical protein
MNRKKNEHFGIEQNVLRVAKDKGEIAIKDYLDLMIKMGFFANRTDAEAGWGGQKAFLPGMGLLSYKGPRHSFDIWVLNLE